MDAAFGIALIGTGLGVALVTGIAVWLWRGRTIVQLQQRTVTAEAALHAERNVYSQQTAAATKLEDRMREAFAALSHQALQTNTDHVLNRIEATLKSRQDVAASQLNGLIDPLKTTLGEYRQQLGELEQHRASAYGNLQQQLHTMVDDQRLLQQETRRLVNALRQPQTRGRWGELQLRRVIEMAGMSELCDFAEQVTITTADNARQRPDLHVRLPNNRCIIVDSKVPLSAYLEAYEAADDAVRADHLKAHARQVRTHVDALSSKNYQQSIVGAHDFVVLFIPGEVFYNAALQHDHELLEYAFSKDIILANPATLVALLKAVALGWRETRLTEHTEKIQQLGTEMYKRLSTLVQHISELGKHLSKANQAYNSTIGSLERQFLVSARRMHELQIGSNDIDAPASVDVVPRTFSSPEFAVGERTDSAV